MNREAYLLLPAASLTTLITNLPLLMDNGEQQPVIIMDSYDYQRLQGRAIRQRDTQKVQLRWLILETLRQRGLVKTVDYARFYSADTQNRNINRYREALDTLPDGINQQATSTTAEGYLDYLRGEYQKPVRVAFNDWDSHLNRRQQVSTQHRKVEQGLGDPIGWNERVFSQYIAALEVRAALNRYVDLNVVGVLGQGEQEGISTILRSAELDFDDTILQLRNGHSIERVGRPDPAQTAAYHGLFETVTTTAQETTGTQHHDWLMLGPRLAAPLLPDILPEAKGLNGIEQNRETIVEETKQVLSYLDKEATDNHPTHLQYEAERIAEHHEIPTQKTDEIADQLGTAADLANHSDDLRELIDEDRFSSGALFLAASIKMDPEYRYHRDQQYRQTIEQRIRLAPVTVSDPEIEFFTERGRFRRGGDGRAWYQIPDREQGAATRYHSWAG